MAVIAVTIAVPRSGEAWCTLRYPADCCCQDYQQRETEQECDDEGECGRILCVSEVCDVLASPTHYRWRER